MQDQHKEDLAAWEVERQELERFVEEARTFSGESDDGVPEVHINLRKGERIFLVGQGAALIEPKRAQGHYEGGYSGVSFRIAKGVRLSTGGMRGKYVPGEEKPNPIEQGTVVITNQRVTFLGQQKTREWAFSKLIALEHHPTLPWTNMPVSNRQKSSGILYDDATADLVRFRLTLALAHFNGTVDTLASETSDELNLHLSRRPQLTSGA